VDVDAVLAILDQVDALTKLIRGLVKKQPPPVVDVTPPSNPTSLGVTLVSNVPHLSWTASTDNVQVVGYQIWRKTGSGGTYAQIDISLVTVYDDSTAALGSTYFYKVAAYDSAVPPNVSGYSNEVSQAVSGSDVTAPNIPAQPAAATVNNSVTPPTYSTNWSAVTDIDPGLGAPVSGVKDYLVYHDYPVAGTLQGTVAQTGTVGSATGYVIGANNGGSAVTGSDSAGTLSSTSTTGDLNAQHWGTSDEFFYSAAPVQGAGSAFIKITGFTPFGSWPKVGLELRNDLSAGASYSSLLYFGANGIKGEQRTLAGAAATGGSLVANPGTPLWLKLIWDASWNVTRQYSTNSTNGTDGTWTTYDTIQMAFGTVAFIGKFADANSAGGTGGTVSATYTNFTVAGASPLVWNGTGVAGQTINVTVKARDNALNVSAASTARAVTFTSPGTAADQYPRAGGYIIAGTVAQQTLQSASDRQKVATLKLAVPAAYTDSWFNGLTLTRDQTYQDCKTRAAALGITLKLFQYCDYIENWTSRASATLQSWWDLINTNNWWMYRLGTSGTKVPSPFNTTSFSVINPTHSCPVDGSGLYPFQRAGQHAYDFLITGSYGAYNKAPSIDGLYQDVMAWKPYASGSFDVTRDGTADNAADSTTQHNWRIGQNDLCTKWKALSGKMVGGNMGDWYATALPSYTDTTTVDPYNTNHEMGVWENALGSYNGEHTAEYYWDTGQAMAAYKWNMGVLQAPKLLIVYHACNADGSDEVTPTPPYQAARWGMGFMAMDDGYWFGTQGQGGMLASRIMDLDETHGGDLNDYNWLGAAAEGPTSAVTLSSGSYVIAAYQNGVCKREFQKGVVIMWPEGKTGSVTLPYPTKRLTGSINPSVNNGQTYAAGAAISPPGGTSRNALFLIKT
jgi:hypothetical protein